MRPNFPAILPLLMSFIAFILAMLCIFAGSTPSYLPSADMLTLNTSMLGRNLSTAALPTNTKSPIVNDVLNAIKGDVQTAVASLVKDLGIHDFYSAHVLDYCEGYYTPGPVANLTNTPSLNVTHCSNQTRMFHFDPAAIIQSELKPGVNLTALHWPSAIQDGMKAIALASKVMFVLYCMTAATAGVAFLGALVGLFSAGKFAALFNCLLCLVGFMASMIASAIATAIINNVVGVVNSHGNDIGVYAYKGFTFLGMTWAATGLILGAALAWVVVAHLAKRGSASSIP